MPKSPKTSLTTILAAAVLLPTAFPAPAQAAPRECIFQDAGANEMADGSGGLIGTSMWLRMQEREKHRDLKRLGESMAKAAASKPGAVNRSVTCAAFSSKLSSEEKNCGKLAGGECFHKVNKQTYGTKADNEICARRVQVVKEIGRKFGCPEGDAGKLWIPRQ